jgi:hypothetical protein
MFQHYRIIALELKSFLVLALKLGQKERGMKKKMINNGSKL